MVITTAAVAVVVSVYTAWAQPEERARPPTWVASEAVWEATEGTVVRSIMLEILVEEVPMALREQLLHLVAWEEIQARGAAVRVAVSQVSMDNCNIHDNSRLLFLYLVCILV